MYAYLCECLCLFLSARVETTPARSVCVSACPYVYVCACLCNICTYTIIYTRMYVFIPTKCKDNL